MAPRRALTSKKIESLKHTDKRQIIADGLVGGLNLVVRPKPSDVKTWRLWLRVHGKQETLTLGRFPTLGQAEARRMAKDALAKAAEGINPAEAKRRAWHETVTGKNLVTTIAGHYVERHAKKNKSWKETERILRHDILPHLGDRKIQDITRRDVIDLIDRIVDRGSPVQANAVLAQVKALFNWCKSRDIIAISPVDGVKKPTEVTNRDRVLSDAEIRLLWTACEALKYPFGPMTKMLLLTGCRLAEAAEATWDELDRDARLWCIPGERTKNGEPHNIPLSTLTITVLEALPRIGVNGYLFTTIGRRPVSGFSKAKRALDRLAGINQHWTFHDLRRTAASGMARLGINLPVIEKVLNHTSGSFGGIVGVYQRHSFTDEKKTALETWGSHVATLMNN